MKALLLILVVVLLSGCGGSVAPEGGNDDPPDVVPNAVESECGEQLGPLLVALEEIDGRLNVGLNYGDYAEKVGDASVAYERIDIEELGPNCLERVGSPAEGALNHYITAYQTWNACFEDTDCEQDSITSDLQSEWADATVKIEEAQEALDE